MQRLRTWFLLFESLNVIAWFVVSANGLVRIGRASRLLVTG